MSEQLNDQAAQRAHAELVCIYDKLRTEILHNDTAGFQLLGFAFLLVSAALGFAFKLPSESMLKIAIFLGNMFLLFICMYQTIERVGGTFMIATYMREFIEPHTQHLMWETRLQKLRILSTDQGVNIVGTHVTTYFCTALANLFLIIFYTIQLQDPHTARSAPFVFQYFMPSLSRGNIAAIVSVFATILWIVMMIYGNTRYRKYVRNNQVTFGDQWQKIIDPPPTNYTPPATSATEPV